MSPSYPDMPLFLAPISLQCSTCEKENPLFDPQRNGYDAEIDDSDDSVGAIGSGQPTQFLCSNCSGISFTTAVLLEYSIEDEEMEDWPELAQRPQDFFTGFSIFGLCSSCGELQEVTTYECA